MPPCIVRVGYSKRHGMNPERNTLAVELRSCKSLMARGVHTMGSQHMTNMVKGASRTWNAFLATLDAITPPREPNAMTLLSPSTLCPHSTAPICNRCSQRAH